MQMQQQAGGSVRLPPALSCGPGHLRRTSLMPAFTSSEGGSRWGPCTVVVMHGAPGSCGGRQGRARRVMRLAAGAAEMDELPAPGISSPGWRCSAAPGMLAASGTPMRLCLIALRCWQQQCDAGPVAHLGQCLPQHAVLCGNPPMVRVAGACRQRQQQQVQHRCLSTACAHWRSLALGCSTLSGGGAHQHASSGRSCC